MDVIALGSIAKHLEGDVGFLLRATLALHRRVFLGSHLGANISSICREVSFGY